MSLANINPKGTKGKQKALPKLKAILANPFKTRRPVLDEKQLGELKLLLENAIHESKLEPRVFARQKGICLGLESSLRKINNQTSSCVFISLSIKPNYVVSLIARNAETKDETQPVYAQPKLGDFIQEIFGIQALCMVFTKDLLAFSEEISKWVEKRKKINKKIKVPETKRTTIKKKIKKPVVVNRGEIKHVKTKSEYVEENIELKSEKQGQSCSGDYISFGSGVQGIKTSNMEGDAAIDALKEIIDKIPVSPKAVRKTERKSEDMDVHSDREFAGIINEEESSDTDDFLSEYKTLTVHKIKGNPNKNPKKKRKKNKKKKPVK